MFVRGTGKEHKSQCLWAGLLKAAPEAAISNLAVVLVVIVIVVVKTSV